VWIDGHDLNTACGQSKAHRGSMSHARRDEILTRYGLPPGEHPDYEIDHLIPLCLGGSDDPSNLWPEPRRTIEPKWNAEAKDRLERLMCDMVCNGQLDIGTAQEAFAKDWIASLAACSGVGGGGALARTSSKASLIPSAKISSISAGVGSRALVGGVVVGVTVI
jgi:hypothetical protein